MTGDEHDPLDPIEHESAEEPFVIVDDEATDDLISDDVPVVVAEDELDGLRIRQLVHLRRSNIRSQTYAIVGMVACAVASIKLAMIACKSFTDSALLYAAAYGAVAVAGAVGAILFAVNADRLRAELKLAPGESEHSPDFELLSDGSHHVRNLHEMHDEQC